MVDGALPEFFIEGQRQGGQFSQLEHHAADGNGVRFHLFPPPLQRCQLGFGFLKAAAQFGMGGAVVFFGHGIGCVFFNAQAQHPSDEFFFQSLNIRIDEVRVREHPLGIAEPVDGSIPVGKILTKGSQIQFFQSLLGQMGRFAFAFPFELAVALPDNTAVTVGGVPGLGTENPAAVGTKDLPGEGAGLTVPTAAAFTLLQLCLDVFPFPRLDNGRVAVLYIILWHFSLVDLFPICKNIFTVIRIYNIYFKNIVCLNNFLCKDIIVILLQMHKKAQTVQCNIHDDTS